MRTLERAACHPLPVRRRSERDGKVRGLVYRAIEMHLIRKAGLTRSKARTGAVTLIQRFGSALNLNIHFHMLFLDGVYVPAQGGVDFRRVKPPSGAELDVLIYRISEGVGRYLEPMYVSSYGSMSSANHARVKVGRRSGV